MFDIFPYFDLCWVSNLYNLKAKLLSLCKKIIMKYLYKKKENVKRNKYIVKNVFFTFTFTDDIFNEEIIL